MEARQVGLVTTVPGEWMVLQATLSGDSGSFAEKARESRMADLASLQPEDSAPGNEIEETAAPLSPETNRENASAKESHGSGRVVITSIRFFDGSGVESLQLEHGKPYAVYPRLSDQ